MCKFQRVQIVNVLNVLSFLKKGHTGAAETVFRAQQGPALRSSVTKLFLEEDDVGLLTSVCNFKQQKSNIQKQNHSQLLLDLGIILKRGNLLMRLSTDSMRSKHLEK